MTGSHCLPKVVAVLALAASTAAWAGPPFLTDDPEPVEVGRWEINSAITAARSGGETSVGAPSIDVNYGAMPNVQVHAQPRYSHVEDDAGRRNGLDDTELGVKYRFLDVARGDMRTMAGIYPMYQAATGARRLGGDRGRHQVFLPLWVLEEIGKWTVYGGSGYRFNRMPQGRNSVFSGLTMLYAFSDTLQVGGEIFTESAVAGDGVRTRGGNVGGTAKLSKRLNLLFSAGHSSGRTSQALAYIGLQAHF